MTTIVQSPRARWLLAAACLASVSAVQAQTTPTLPETTITATRFPDIERTLPFGVSVITADDIRASGARNVDEALMRLLGVVGRQDLFGGGEYDLDLRGFGETADQNQVVIVDGVRITEQDLGGTRMSGIPIESVERIEVLHGNASVLYGEGATAGAIVITTKAGLGRQQPNAAAVYGSVGSFNTHEAAADVSGSKNGFSLDAHAQKRHSDGFRDNFATDTDAASATAQWSGDWLRVGARAEQDDLDTGLPGALTTAQYASNPRQTNTPDDHAIIHGQRGSVFAKGDLGPWQLAFDAADRTKRLRSVESGFPFDYDIDAQTFSLRARREDQWGTTANALVFGSDVDHWARDVLGAFGAQASQQTTALYAKDDVTFASRTRLSFGVRQARISKSDTSATANVADNPIAWDLGASQALGGGFTAYGRFGHSFRLPYIDEFNFTTPGTLLRPQTSQDLEVGTRWEDRLDKVDMRLYRSLLTDEIGFDPAAAGPLGPFGGANVNFDPTRHSGVELEASRQVRANLGLRLNAAWREAKFRSGPNAGRDLPLVPHASVAVRADWTPAAQQRLSGGVNWVSSQHPDFANACTMPSYLTMDARYAYQYRAAEFALGVSNLLDRKYYTQAFGCENGLTTSIYPEAGRAVTASVRVHF